MNKKWLDEATHTYMIGDKPADVISATTLIGKLFGNAFQEKKVNGWDYSILRKQEMEHTFAHYKEATESLQAYNEHRMWVGTETHKSIETYLNGETPLILNDEVQQLFDIWLEWAKDKDLTGEQEKVYINEDYGVAGTIDLIKTDEIMDWKTNNSMSNDKLKHYEHQMQIYGALAGIDNATIVHFNVKQGEVKEYNFTNLIERGTRILEVWKKVKELNEN